MQASNPGAAQDKHHSGMPMPYTRDHNHPGDRSQSDGNKDKGDLDDGSLRIIVFCGSLPAESQMQ
jgi:hypothetical protein